MSRTSFSSRSPLPGRTYRPRLDVLEDRLAPGCLLGTSEPPLIEPESIAEEQRREAAEVAAVAGLSAGQSQAAISPPSEVRSIADGTVRGSSTLVRTDNGVSIHVETSGLLPGAYTAWWAVFNTPGMGPPTAGFATAHVVGPNGTATFAAHLNEGEILQGHPLSGGSLVDARAAEIHFVIRYHGPVDPGRIDEQLGMFELPLDSDGDPATGNVQVAVHLPPA